MLELAIPLAASVLITILLRRLDKSNVNMRKLKTIIERGQKELSEITLRKKEELHDATTQFDLALVNADKYLNSLREELLTAQTSLGQVQESRSNLQQMDVELQSLEKTTRGVQDQIRYVNESLDRIDEQKKKVKKLQDHISAVDEEAAKMITVFQKALRSKSEEVLHALENRFTEVTAETNDYQEELKQEMLGKQAELSNNVHKNYEKLENRLKESAEDLSVYLESRIEDQLSTIDSIQSKANQSEQSLNVTIPNMIRDMKESLLSDLSNEQQRLEAFQSQMTSAEEGFRKKLDTFKIDLESQRSNLFQDLFDEAEKIRDQIQTLDLETIAKKDELVMSTRLEASKVQDNIEKFNVVFAQAKEGLQSQISKYSETLDSKIVDHQRAAEVEFQNYLANMKNSAEETSERFTAAVDDKVGELNDQISNLQSKVNQSEQGLNLTIPKMIKDMKEDLLSDLSNEQQRLEAFQSQMSLAEEGFRKKLDTFKVDLESQRSNLFQDIFDEAERIRDQIQTLDLETIAKKDELVMSTRLEASKVQDNIEKFNVVFAQAKEGLQSQISKYSETLDSKIVDYQRAAGVEFQNYLATMKSLAEETSERFTAAVDDKVGELNDQIGHLQSKVNQSEQGLNVTIPKMIKDMKEDLLSDLSNEQQRLEAFQSQMSLAEEGFRKKLDTFKVDLESQRSNLFQDIFDEAEKIRDQIQTLDLETIAKKDELVMSTRLEASKVQDNIEEFNVVFAQAKEGLQSQISKYGETLDSKIEDYQRAAEVEFQSYLATMKNSAEETSERFTAAVDDKVDELNDQIGKYSETLDSKIEDYQRAAEVEFQHYLATMKNSAEETSECFTEAVDNKVGDLSDQIGNLEKELLEVRDKSTDDIGSRMARIFNKLGTIEKNLVESQKHLIDQWEGDTASLVKTIGERESQFVQMAEKWQGRLELMSKEASGGIHKASIAIEKKSSETIQFVELELQSKLEQFEAEAKEIQAENERSLSEILSGFRAKVQEREDLLFEKVSQMASRSQELRKSLEDRHDQVLEALSQEKKALANELKSLSENQYHLFNKDLESLVKVNSDSYRSFVADAISSMRDETGKILEDFVSIKGDVEETFNEFKVHQQEILTGILSEAKNTGKEVTRLKENLNELKKDSEMLERSKETSQYIQDLIATLESKLGEVQGKSQTLEGMFKQIEELKDVRLKLDSELVLMAQKREKVDKLEDQMQIIINLKDEIDEKEASMNRIKIELQEIMNQFNAVDEQKELADQLIDDFVKQQDVLTAAISSIQEQDKKVINYEGQLQGLGHIIDKLTGKTDIIKSEMDGIQDQMVKLQKQETDIQEIRRRFLEIEDLIEDIDRRKNQIDILRKRFEELRQSMSSSVSEIEQIEHDADSKVKKLSEFLSAVDIPDINSPIITKNLKPAAASNGIGDKKQLVMTLGEMGWSANEIAERINLDVGTIQTILSTFAH